MRLFYEIATSLGIIAYVFTSILLVMSITACSSPSSAVWFIGQQVHRTRDVTIVVISPPLSHLVLRPHVNGTVTTGLMVAMDTKPFSKLSSQPDTALVCSPPEIIR